MSLCRAENIALACLLSLATCAIAQSPSRPIITEVFTDPAGVNDGPVGRDPANPSQGFIEIYLPTLGDLAAGLNKDALRLTFYEVEGDSSSSGNELVNYRIDLPTFDLDPSNGMTGLPRPANGVVVLGWVDYVGNPPTDLAGTPSTRVALINGGVTSTTDFTFIAINGNQFTGTTNFATPVAVSSIDLPNEATSGIIQNGSAAYLLVNRDDVGYVELFDDKQVPIGQSADPSLATGTVLGVSSLLDGFAANDHKKFDVLCQPYATPTGDDIDLETTLPLGGPFSNLVAQVAEANGNGYARIFVDVAKTVENASSLDDDPVADALNAYRLIHNNGPFFSSPGRAALTSSAPRLSIAAPAVQRFGVLAGTTGRPGIIAANVGGHFAIDVTASPGASSNPAIATLAAGAAVTVMTGQTPVNPQVEITAASNAADSAIVTAPVTVTATNVNGLDPPVENPVQATTATVRVLNPTTGRNAGGLPFQATTFVAMQGLPNGPELNEFLTTSLSTFVAANLGGIVDDERNNGAALLSPTTDLSDPLLVDVFEDDMPDSPALFINVPSPAGLDDLVTTILNSAETVAGTDPYADNFNATFTAVRAVELNIAETRTAGGLFTPTEPLYFASSNGMAGSPNSGLSAVTTTQGFELALLDTNVQQLGTLESGQTDDFGLIVEVGQVRAGASVVPGEFVFLSYMGGFEGADIDTVDVPPHNNQTVIIYVDLDLLDTILGARTITRLFVIDGSGGSAINVIEAFSLNGVQPFDHDADGDVDLLDYADFFGCFTGPGVAAAVGCDIHDFDGDTDVDLADFDGLQTSFTN